VELAPTHRHCEGSLTAAPTGGLPVIDTFSRFSPAVDPRFSYRGEDVVATLERACRSVGYPKTIRVDQGSEFISRNLPARKNGAENSKPIRGHLAEADHD
jgi:transposase InsO family protein